MHKIDVKCFGIKYKKSKSSSRKMGKYKHKAVKELSDHVKEHTKKEYELTESIMAEKAMAMKVKQVDKVFRGPNHKVPERCSIFDRKTEELITDENEILATTLKYNIGVLTKNKIQKQDLPEVEQKNKERKQIMQDKTKGEPLSLKTYKAVLKHKKKENKNMFRHINKAGALFKQAMFVYMSIL